MLNILSYSLKRLVIKLCFLTYAMKSIVEKVAYFKMFIEKNTSKNCEFYSLKEYL